MRVFVDTSAFYALASSSDEFHERAKEIYEDIVSRDAELITSSYVLLETIALIQNRLGFSVLKEFVEAIRASFRVIWVDEKLHYRAWELLKKKQNVSFVDCASFSILRRSRSMVFAFDRDFEQEGFQVL